MGKIQRTRGLSSGANIRTSKHRSYGGKPKFLKASGQEERRSLSRKERSDHIEELSAKDRHMIAEMDEDNTNIGRWEFQTAMDSMVPGEEGYGLSHEGGEHEVFEDFAHELAESTGIRRADDRNRRRRMEIRREDWERVYESLVDAYLSYRHECDEEWKYRGSRGSSSGSSFITEVVDLFYRRRQPFESVDSDAFPVVTLMRHGFMAVSPLYPTVAISVRTLAQYRQTHRVCPRLSIQAEVRKLCHIHGVPYRRYLAEQFSIAYDVYLEILHRVDLRVNTALGRDEPDWRLRNGCPCCFYKLQDEPPLKYSFFCEMDGVRFSETTLLY